MKSNMMRTMTTMRLMVMVWAVLALTGTAAMAQMRAPAGNEIPTHDASEQMGHEGHDHGEDPLAMHGAHGPMSRSEHEAFAAAVDLSPVRTLSVFDNGRAKVLDSLAREVIESVYGKTRWKDLETGETYDPVFTYLDMVFNGNYYLDKPLVYVENLEVRRALLRHLPVADQETWLRRGRLAPLMFSDPEVTAAIGAMQADALKMKALGQVQWSLELFVNAGGKLLVVSPTEGSDHWAHVESLGQTHLAQAEPPMMEAAMGSAVVGDPALGQRVLGMFMDLSEAWRAGNAGEVNRLLVEIGESVPQLNPSTYPATWIRQAEYWYNATSKFTYSYIIYLLAFVLLTVGLVTGRTWLLTSGGILVALGFLGHTLGMIVRMVLAGRYTIHNQYESFLMLSWFAAAAGLVLVMWKRQWLYGAAVAGLGAVALMIANTLPIPSQEVGPVAGILATSRILYVHVNVMIFSYAMIALGLVVSLFYLSAHYIGGNTSLRLAAAGLGNLDAVDPETGKPRRGKQALLNDLDKAQMVVLQLAFWLLGVGILLGAWWADHAWGRWWGWDPKETWALITWIVYLIVIHVRFGVKRRGLVTAWLSVVGFLVMVWTHWGVNLLLAGLHSYA